MASAATKIKPKHPPKAQRTRMETMILDQDAIDKWPLPGVQRPFKINQKVRELVEILKANGSFIPGTILIGVIDSGPDKGEYLLDGQHRLEAFRMTEMPECIADIKFIHVEDMAELGAVYVDSNERLRNFTPDDILRALEKSVEPLQIIKEACDFVGYDQVRRNEHSPLLSMSLVLRSWEGSATEVPQLGSVAARSLAEDMTTESARACAQFLNVAIEAWGRDTEYARLWNSLNLTLTMWLWRRMVLMRDSRPGTKRAIFLNATQFKKCLMSLSASSAYVDWLVGRKMSERDRAPAFTRIKQVFSKRIQQETGSVPKLPAPAWSTHKKG